MRRPLLHGRVRALALLALLAWVGADAAAQTAGDGTAPRGSAGRAESAVADALAAPEDARAVDAVLRLHQLDDLVGFERFGRALDRIAAARRLHPSAALLVRYLQASLERRRAGTAAAGPRFAEQGFVQRWSVVGPFDNEGRKGTSTIYGPESETLDPAILEHTYEGKERPMSWLPAEAHLARVPFQRWLYPIYNTCAYAYATVRVARPTAARVWAGADGSLAVWVGGRPALATDKYYSAFPDRFAADVRLPAGAVPLLVKVCGERTGMAFYLRVTDPAGRPLRGATFAPRLPEGATPAALAADPVRVPTAYEELLTRGEADEATAADQLVAGRTLQLSGMIDVTDNAAQKLLERAVERAPGAEAYYWLMRAGTDAVKAARAADALALLGDDDPFLLSEAAARRLSSVSVRAADGPSRRALELPGGADDPNAVAVRAMVLRSRDMAGACSALLAGWLATREAVPTVLRQQRACLEAESRAVEAAALDDRLAAADRSDADLRLPRLRRLAARGETEAVRTLGRELAEDFPDDLPVLQAVAAQLQIAGATDDALDLLRRLTTECPQNPQLHHTLGRVLEDHGRRDEALEPYRRALDLEPQNQPLAQYLDFLEQRESMERRWAVEFDSLAPRVAEARRALETATPAERDKLRKGRDLFRQQVDQIHANGLSSRFGQSFTLVQTEDGAEQSRYAQIGFTPGEETFELLRAVVHKPDGHTEDYETHYPISYGGSSYFSDAGAEAIAFPRLGVGDVLELRFRIDGRSRHNKFGEHYSNEVPVLGLNPTDRFLYALVAPETKQLFVHVPPGLGITTDERTENGETVRRYEATALPAIPEEPDAPPYPELARPIQVSTFADWHALARWWWNLAKDQLQPDETIRRRVAEIVAGTDDPAERTARIFDWVIRNTRYVALEFGIHGWKPYRAHEVVSRGFGDCKDKASLIYTMLAAAGIEARLVLVRTRAYRGRQVSEFPSPGQFDHMIAYVPAFDLFLDGTVILASHTELPAMDRGAFALIVGPDDERTTIIPQEPQGPDRLETEYSHEVGPDGAAAGTLAIRARGAYAQGWRGRLQATETRRKRVEEALGAAYPGLVLGDFSVDGLDDFRQPVVLHARADVPQLASGGAGTFSIRAARPKDLARRYAGLATRQLDVELYEPIHESQIVRYRLPDAATGIDLPERHEAHDGNRSFVMEVTRDGNTVRVAWELHVPDPRIPAAEYAGFRAFCAAVDAALAEPITYAIP